MGDSIPSYTKGDFDVNYGAISNHEQKLIIIAMNYFKIKSFDGVGTDRFDDMIGAFTSDKQLHAQFDIYFNQNPTAEADKNYFVEKVYNFFVNKKSDEEIREAHRWSHLRQQQSDGQAHSAAALTLLDLSRSGAKPLGSGGYKRKTSKKHRKRYSSRKKHRKRYSSRKKHRKRRTRRH